MPKDLENDLEDYPQEETPFYKEPWFWAFFVFSLVFLAMNIWLVLAGLLPLVIGFEVSLLASSLVAFAIPWGFAVLLKVVNWLADVSGLSAAVTEWRVKKGWLVEEKKDLEAGVGDVPDAKHRDSITPSSSPSSSSLSRSSEDQSISGIPILQDSKHTNPVQGDKDVPQLSDFEAYDQICFNFDDDNESSPISIMYVSTDPHTRLAWYKETPKATPTKYAVHDFPLEGAPDGKMYIAESTASNTPPYAWYLKTRDANPESYVVLDLAKKGGDGKVYLALKPLSNQSSLPLNEAWYQKTIGDKKLERYIVKSYAIPCYLNQDEHGEEETTEETRQWSNETILHARKNEMIEQESSQKKQKFEQIRKVQQVLDGEEPLPLWDEERENRSDIPALHASYDYPKIKLHRVLQKFIEGTSLTELMDSSEEKEEKKSKPKELKAPEIFKNKTLSERIRLLVELLQCVRDNVHGKHVVHLDLNSGNFMRKPDGTWKVIDLDDAVLVDAKLDDHHIFHSPMPKGMNLAMAAPERGRNEAGKPSDIFSLSAIVILLLRRIRTPYNGRGLLKNIYEGLEEKIRTMRRIQAKFAGGALSVSTFSDNLVSLYLEKSIKFVEKLYKNAKEEFLKAPFDVFDENGEGEPLPRVDGHDLENISLKFLARMMAHEPAQRPTIKEVTTFYETVEKCIFLIDSPKKEELPGYLETLNRLASPSGVVVEVKREAFPLKKEYFTEVVDREINRLDQVLKSKNRDLSLPAVIFPRIDKMLFICEQKGEFPFYLEKLINDDAYICMFALNPQNHYPAELISEFMREEKALRDKKNTSLRAKWYREIFDLKSKKQGESDRIFIERTWISYLREIKDKKADNKLKEARRTFITFVEDSMNNKLTHIDRKSILNLVQELVLIPKSKDSKLTQEAILQLKKNTQEKIEGLIIKSELDPGDENTIKTKIENLAKELALSPKFREKISEVLHKPMCQLDRTDKESVRQILETARTTFKLKKESKIDPLLRLFSPRGKEKGKEQFPTTPSVGRDLGKPLDSKKGDGLGHSASFQSYFPDRRTSMVGGAGMFFFDPKEEVAVPPAVRPAPKSSAKPPDDLMMVL